jgi:hypothetical protein
MMFVIVKEKQDDVNKSAKFRGRVRNMPPVN